jgi:hypothetical protein
MQPFPFHHTKSALGPGTKIDSMPCELPRVVNARQMPASLAPSARPRGLLSIAQANEAIAAG